MNADDDSFADSGDLGESEAVHEPHRDDEPPRRERAFPAVWLTLIALMVLLMLGLLVAWMVGFTDVG